MTQFNSLSFVNQGLKMFNYYYFRLTVIFPAEPGSDGFPLDPPHPPLQVSTKPTTAKKSKKKLAIDVKERSDASGSHGRRRGYW